ncbi:hypothetical protein Baya_4067 [Bagarius yarrelli]|uniref:Uncharacterized protein n=1 Tax=Bagarius yarrelli TaxID=175774 RepID=A0A556TXC9_BAGYA|nr:hypothetical protein Baya_4067 [Bagarius yarrelli]
MLLNFQDLKQVSPMLQVSFSCSTLALPDLCSSLGVYHSLTCQRWNCWQTKDDHAGGMPERRLPSTSMVRLKRRSMRLIPHISLPIHPINKDPALPLLQSVLGRYEGGAESVSAAYVRTFTLSQSLASASLQQL